MASPPDFCNPIPSFSMVGKIKYVIFCFIFLKPRLIEHLFYSLAAYLGKTFPKPSGFSLYHLFPEGSRASDNEFGVLCQAPFSGICLPLCSRKFLASSPLAQSSLGFDCSRVIITFALSVSALGKAHTPTGLCRAVKACLPLKGTCRGLLSCDRTGQAASFSAGYTSLLGVCRKGDLFFLSRAVRLLSSSLFVYD